MKARSALFGAAVLLALLGVGTSHALSLKSSAAEAFLADASPGSTVVYSKVHGTRLRLENAGPEKIRVEMKAAQPPGGGLKDGYEPWPYPDRVRLEMSRTGLDPGGTSEVDIVVLVPKDRRLAGGQYQFDALATAYGGGGATLTLKTRVLMSIGPPLAKVDEEDSGAPTDGSGFALSPPSAALEKVPWEDDPSPGGWTTLRLVNAGDQDMTVSLAPARDWDESVRMREGYVPAPNPRWLRLESDVVKVRAGAIGSARVKVAVPRQARYAGRRWAFVLTVDAVSGGRKTRRWFVLNVRTPDMEENGRTR